MFLQPGILCTRIYKQCILVLALFSAVLPLSARVPATTLTLVNNSVVKAVLVIPKLAVAEEKKAANEIQFYIAKISGTTLKIINEEEDRDGLTPVFIGRAASQGIENSIRKKGIDPYSFAIIITNRHIALRGLSPRGTLVAAYELLEKIGVRWFMPGDIGTVIPESKTIAFKYGTTIQTPSFPSRYHAGSRRDEWNEHMKMGGLRFPSSHGLQFTREAPYEKRPELYSLVKGQRVNRQHCISNPEVVKLIVAQTKSYFKKNPDVPWLGMGPNDDGGYCECNNCVALDGGDFDPLTNYMSMTDRYIWFYNQVLAGIKDEFPNKKIAFYAYAEYVRPPVKHKPDQRIVPAMAPITLCRIHGMNNPVCPERKEYRKWILGWKALLPDVYERGYWWNLSDPGLPFSSVHRMRDEIPAGYKLGLEGWRTETADHWGSETPSLYIAAKLMWDHKADVDALLNDFYSKFFGAAAAAMKTYFTIMDSALKNGNYHTGGAYYVHNVYPDKLRNRAGAALLKAMNLATNELFKKRIAMFRMTFDYLELFITMQRSAFAFDFKNSKNAMDSIMILQEKLFAHQPKLINERVGRTYLHRFYTGPVKSGYERTTGDNQLLKGLKYQWKFIKDENKNGIEKKYWEKNYGDSKWKDITVLKSWSDQGMRYYRGEAWYRQSILIPKEATNKQIILWFAGADEFAEVWLNGTRLGTSSPNTFVAFEMGPEQPMMEGLAGSGFYPQPFEFDVSSLIVPGKQNIITVRIENNLVNELGTGGIMGPVMFYETKSMK